MNSKTRQEIIAVLQTQGRPDLAEVMATLSKEDHDKVLRLCQGMLQESRKHLGKEDRTVWLGIASAVMELTKVVQELNPSLGTKLYDIGQDILMAGRKS